jgi:hypothetical protein
MRLLLPAIAVVLVAAPAAAAGDTARAALGVETTVVSRCVVATAPGGEATVRCTRGATAPAIGTPRGPEPLVLERAATGQVTASALAPVSGAGLKRLVSIEF